MLKRIFVYCLLLLLSSHAFGKINADEKKFNNLLNDCIELQFAEQDSPSLNKKIDLLEICPDLSIFLATRNHNDFIQPPLESKTSLNRLIDEQVLRQQSYTIPTSTRTDISLVNKIAKHFDFNSTKAKEPGWWQLFKQWLKEKYSNSDEDANIDWLLKLLDGFSIPDWLYNSLLYGSIGLIIIFAIIIVANEFRHYKRFKDRDYNSIKTDLLPPIHQLQKLSWDQIQHLPLNQKTSALLQYLIQQCINREWLPNNNSFTNREFYQALKKYDANKAFKFNKVINTAEQDIYGKHPLSAEELKQLFLITKNMLETEKAISA